MTYEKLTSCIETCHECAVACDHCTRECLKEADLTMVAACIELNRECVVACRAAVALMSIGGQNATALCNTCAEICEACADECENHQSDHCQECAETCRACAEECRKMVKEMV